MKTLLTVLTTIASVGSPCFADVNAQKKPELSTPSSSQSGDQSAPQALDQKTDSTETVSEDRGPASNSGEGVSEDMVRYLKDSGKRVEAIFDETQSE